MTESKKQISILTIALIILVIGGVFFSTAYFLLLHLEDRLINESATAFEEKIKTVYNESEIKELVDTLLTEKIKETIDDAVKKELEPVIADLTGLRKEYVNGLSRLNEKQKNYSEVNRLNELTMLAENGDRKAFDALREMAIKKDKPYAKLAMQNVLRIFDKFRPDPNKHEYYNEQVSDAEVVQMLSSPNVLNRRIAIKTIRHRKMIDQISTLIVKLATEDNLEILAIIYAVLNDLLDTKISLLQPDGGALFVEAWTKYKESNKQSIGVN